jgi:hypothetical protein
MSTILWCPSSGTAAVSPTPSAATWTLHVNSVSRPLNFTRGDTALTVLQYYVDGAVDHIVDGNSMIAQFVSQILPPQTIAAQQIAYGARMIEEVNSNTLFCMLRLYGCNVTGTTNLGTILAGERGTTELATSDNARVQILAGSAVTFNEPWRLVAEWGVGGLPVAGAGIDSHNASITFGDPFAVGASILPQNNDNTACPAIIIFSNDIITTFGGDGASLYLGV